MSYGSEGRRLYSSEIYHFRLIKDEKNGIYVAYCLEFESLKVHGDTIEEVVEELVVIDDMLADLEAKDKPMPIPYNFDLDR